MKRYWIVVLVMALVFIGAQFAMAAGNFYIPGSRDIEGGLGEDGKSFEKLHIGNRATFEGTTSDAYETTIFATEPTADRTITLPDSSGTVSLTSGAFAGALADGKIYIGNSAGTAVEVTPSGDWTITNAGVNSLGANTVGALQSNINTVTLLVAATTNFNSVTVDSTHVLMSYYLTTIGGINGANLVNDLAYDGTGVWTMAMVNAPSTDSVWTLNFLKAD